SLPYEAMDKRMQQHEAYLALPAKVAQQVLKQVDQAWRSFFAASQAYQDDPKKFRGRPKLPKYLHKTTGRNLLGYTQQALSGGRPLQPPPRKKPVEKPAEPRKAEETATKKPARTSVLTRLAPTNHAPRPSAAKARKKRMPKKQGLLRGE